MGNYKNDKRDGVGLEQFEGELFINFWKDGV